MPFPRSRRRSPTVRRLRIERLLPRRVFAGFSAGPEQACDFGDAPASYRTFLQDDGPRHRVTSLRLGDTVTAETDGQPGVQAVADDSDDGVQWITTLVAHPTANTIGSFVVHASGRGKLDGWIDLDSDGSFDPVDEHINRGQSLSISTGRNFVPISIPAGAVSGETFARFRFSTNGGLRPVGEAEDGEVEDYRITLVDGSQVSPAMLQAPNGTVTLSRSRDAIVVNRRGTNLFRVPIAALDRLEVSGDPLSNVLAVDFTGGSPIPSGGLTFDGGGSINTVRITGELPTLDVTDTDPFRFSNVDAFDLSDSPSTRFVVDSASSESIDPDGSGVIVVGSPGDQIEFNDAAQWRMAEPITIANSVFSRIEQPEGFIQVDFASPWQNLANHNDVNNDGSVSVTDVLQIINELIRREFSDLQDGRLVAPNRVTIWPDTYFDQNGDELVTAIDALRVINELVRRTI